MTGDELRRQRGRLCLTQRELANRVGVGLRTVTSWESLGPRPLPGTAEGRLTAIFGLADVGPPRGLSEVSDLELIAELARRLGLPRVGTTAERTAGATADGSFSARSSTEEDYPSDASAQGIVGTPRNETVDQPTAARPTSRNGWLQPVVGDSPERRHRRQRP
jgi:hypothetical protein